MRFAVGQRVRWTKIVREVLGWTLDVPRGTIIGPGPLDGYVYVDWGWFGSKILVRDTSLEAIRYERKLDVPREPVLRGSRKGAT
jgi:hypothetical protein